MGTPEGGAEWVPLWSRDAIGSSDLITNAQQALVAMVKDWNYDYGAEQALLRDVAWDGPEASSRGKH